MNKGIKLEVEVTKCGDSNVAIVRLPKRMRVLATTLVNGGFVESDTMLIIQVGKGYDNREPDQDMRSMCSSLSLKSNTVCFMTAADVPRAISVAEESHNGVHASVVATAGVVNSVVAGELVPESVIASIMKPGTINVVVAVDVPLKPSGLANAIITATEAKTAAMMDCGIRGTGTTSDAVAVACPIGEGSYYAGTATDVGIALSRAVRKAVAESITKWERWNTPPNLLERLEAVGVTMDDMWAAAKALYYPNPNWSDSMIEERFRAHLRLISEDVNVNALVHAAILMEDEGNRDRVHGLDRGEFQKDPVHLLADELIAIALVQYISGTRGLFEYTRYDKKKPGILGILGPFLDDIVGALIGGTMSKIQTDLLGAGR